MQIPMKVLVMHSISRCVATRLREDQDKPEFIIWKAQKLYVKHNVHKNLLKPDLLNKSLLQHYGTDSNLENDV